MTLKTIQRGATLGQMVSTYNRENKTKLTVDQVAKANGLKNANQIKAGGKLLFPDQFETNSKQQVITNAEGGKTVRNGAKEQVTVNAPAAEPITTEPAKLGTTVQNRPLEKLPEPPTSKAPVKSAEQPVTTEPTKLGTTVQNRPLEKLPEPPVTKSPVRATQQPVTTEPTKLGTTVQNRPLEKLPEPPVTKAPVKSAERPVTTEPAKLGTTVQNRPYEKLPQAPTTQTTTPTEKQPEAPKTTLSLNEFLAANKGQKLSVDSLRRNGVDAASADLNGDGVIAGQAEQSKLFSLAEKADKNGDKTVADLGNAKVAKNFESISSAQRLDVAPYSQTDLQRVKDTLKEGTPRFVSTLTPDECRAKGLSPGSVAIAVPSSVDESRGMGNKQNSVTIYMDAKSGQYFKEYNNDDDGKNTPMVPLTAAERKILATKNDVNLSPKNATEERAVGQLFGFGYD